MVLDLTLDGCNAGRELLAELRPKPCPILIFTAQDESEMYGENWENLKRLGADDLVIKGMFLSLWAIQDAPKWGLNPGEAMGRFGIILVGMQAVSLMWQPVFGWRFTRGRSGASSWSST